MLTQPHHTAPLVAALLLVLALVAGGCGSESGAADADRLAERTATREARLTATAEAQRATPTPEATPTPADRDGDGILDAVDLCPDEPESPVAGEPSNWDDDTDGCPDDIYDLLLLGWVDVESFWEAEFAAADIEYIPPAFIGYREVIETECGEALLGNAFYCPSEHAVYYDEVFLELELETRGDFGPVFIIAHEWGHVVQGLLGLLDDSRSSIEIELEADCLAGAYTWDAGVRGVLEEGDFEEAVVTLFTVGDPVDFPFFDPAAHGSPGQRIDAFRVGFELGIGACLERDLTTPGS